ncbi:Heterogeneous nuclear ribonucleoprotein D-like protein [Dinothrombium tinctorium]|uniref:Heterogeneous nuclear ribonucleoprotein D-like protein n=1 Tax=Dinothrombium tinctorium TaxID=1965070 RepID=A0A443REB5_9ACAR|nr:Heterogeneous nuclear ribonucleoprotein D-like protein [Dinothrombium tinctorium]
MYSFLIFRKLFLGGLSWDTTEDDIRSYFGKFGTIIDVSIKYDAVTGNPRGFGFITFAEDAIDKVLSTVPHLLNNKVVDPKRAKSRPMCKKIFVGGVDANVSEEDIKSYFSQYGTVKAIELPFDHQRCRRRQFCFIIFDTEAGAVAACREPKQTIGGRECDIKKAQPQPIAHQQKRMQQVLPHGLPGGKVMHHMPAYPQEFGNGAFEDIGRSPVYGFNRNRGGGARRRTEGEASRRSNWRYNRTAVFYNNGEANCAVQE